MNLDNKNLGWMKIFVIQPVFVQGITFKQMGNKCKFEMSKNKKNKNIILNNQMQ